MDGAPEKLHGGRGRRHDVALRAVQEAGDLSDGRDALPRSAANSQARAGVSQRGRHARARHLCAQRGRLGVMHIVKIFLDYIEES